MCLRLAQRLGAVTFPMGVVICVMMGTHTPQPGHPCQGSEPYQPSLGWPPWPGAASLDCQWQQYHHGTAGSWVAGELP